MRAFISVLAFLAVWLTPVVRLFAEQQSDLPPAIAFLPETNPYRSLLAQLHRLPDDQAESLNTWLRAAEADPTLVPDEQTAVLLRDVTRAIAAIPQPSADTELWPVYAPAAATEVPETLLTPPFQLMRQLSLLTRVGARELPPEESIAAYLGLVRLGRSFRTDEGPLLHHMIGLVLEDQARRAVATRFNDFSVESIGEILDLWKTLPPAREGLAMFQGELVFMESNLRCDFLPALKALDAELKSSATAATFTRGLRLSGMVDLGQGESWIFMENELTGKHFRLRSGETVEGLTLVFVDFLNSRAHLRHTDGEAVLDLRAKRITEIPAIVQIKDAISLFLGDAEATAFLEKLIRDLESYPDGAEGYLRDIVRNTERAIAHTVTEALKAKLADIQPWPDLQQTDLLTQMAYSAYPKITRQFLEKTTVEKMFISALQLRRAALGGPAAQPAIDPFSASAATFVVEKTEDGGFTLRSEFETRVDTPLRYKFGSADAGPQ